MKETVIEKPAREIKLDMGLVKQLPNGDVDYWKKYYTKKLNDLGLSQTAKERYLNKIEIIKKITGEKPKEEIETEPEKKEVKIIDNVIKNLPAEDIKIVKEEMEIVQPMEFEPKEVKTNIKTFLCNQIVKFASGFKIPKKIEEMTRKMTRATLLSAGILILWTSKASESMGIRYMQPDNLRGRIVMVGSKEIEENTSKSSVEAVDMLVYKQLSPNARKIYLYSFTNMLDSSYVIVDKPRATMYLIGKDRKLITSMPVLLGQMKGEMENLADSDSNIAYQATTPTGKYTMGQKGTGRLGQYFSSIVSSDSVLYKGKIFTIHGSDNLAIHITYPGELEKRTRALETPTVDDNRLSWGCINLSEENYDKYAKNNFFEGEFLFIIPDSEKDTLNPYTGKVEKVDQVDKFANVKGGDLVEL